MGDPPEQLTLSFVSQTVFKVEKLVKITKHIPEEIVTEIYLRLPIKSLLRFESVSKGSCALIRCPKFSDMHFKHPSQERRSTAYMIFKEFQRRDDSFMFVFYSFDENYGLVRMPTPLGFSIFHHSWLEMCGECNGIICVTGGTTASRRDDIYLCNPATRKSRRLPDRPFWTPPKFKCERIACGFGFDSIKKDFKVVSIMCSWWENDEGERMGNGGILQCELYDLKSNSWREIEVQWPNMLDRKSPGFCGINSWNGPALYLNGCLHWIYPRFTYSNAILCFDINNEEMRQIPYPENPIPKNMLRFHRNIIFLKNSLAFSIIAVPKEELMNRFSGTETSWIFIWVLEGYGGANQRWVKRFSLGPFPVRLRGPIATICNDDALLLLTYGDCLASCNLVEGGNEIKILGTLKYCKSSHGFMDSLIIRKESLHSLN